MLYNCTGEDDPHMSFKIKTLVNEKEMTLPGCESLYCPLERVKQIYAQYLGCDFNSLCGVLPCPSPAEDSSDGWSLSGNETIIVIVTAAAGGILIGMCLLAAVLLLIRRLKRNQVFSLFSLSLSLSLSDRKSVV